MHTAPNGLTTLEEEQRNTHFGAHFFDGYRYGSNAHREIIKRIENEITGADCHFGKLTNGKYDVETY